MDSFDLNTRLPPRKRLLAGLKESSDCDFPIPLPPVSSDIYGRIRDLFNLTASSSEEIIEASRSAALAASEVAARARATAIEKAAAAAKARAAARSALELLDSITRNLARRESRLAKNKFKKKHVPIKLFYGKKRAMEIRETDEELARRLHHTMNSSPRFSSNSHKKRRCSEKAAVSDGSVVCNENSPVFCDGEVQLSNGHSADKFDEKVVVCSKADLLERDGKDRSSVRGKRMKVKRKKLLLSQCNFRDWGKPRGETLTKEPKLNHAERNMSLDDAKASCEGEVPMKMTSVWKCKKFKVSLCSSDSKNSRTLYSNPSAPKASDMVEVD